MPVKPIKQGLVFNGINDWVDMGKIVFPHPNTNWAARMIFCINRFVGDAGIWAEDENASSKIHSFSFNSTTKKLVYNYYDISGVGAVASFDFDPVTGQFYDITIMSIDGSIVCYVDGTLIGSSAVQLVRAIAGTTVGLTLKIGRKRALYSALTIAYMIIYNRSVAPTDPNPRSGIVAEWTFDEGVGTTLTDASGNGNNGTISSALWVIKKSQTVINKLSNNMEVLGMPFSKSKYARNVWDMQVFDNRIYIGHGNSSNVGTASNSGPIPLIYVDSVGQFTTQNGTFNAGGKTSLDEEQIDMFKVLNGKLFIGGHDPKAPDDFSQGNWYDLVSGAATWTKHRNIPLAIHVFDIVYFNGRLFAACGRSITWVEGDYLTTGADVMMSSDEGTTWTKLGTIQNDSYVFRAYTFFQLGSDLYATAEYYTPLWDTVAYVMKISPSFTVTQVQIDTSILFQGVSTSVNDPNIKMYRPVNFLGKCVYLAGFVYNDQQFIPEVLTVMTSLASCAKATFPDTKAIPIDILVRGSSLYVLAFVRQASARYKIIVYKTTDLVTWNEIFAFYHTTFARSFEELNGIFYFGLGCDTEYIPDDVGTVLRTKYRII